MTHTIQGLTERQFYQIHVRAFSTDMNRLGDADRNIIVELKTNPEIIIVVTDDDGNPVSVSDTTSARISTLTLFLPTAETLAAVYSMSNIT